MALPLKRGFFLRQRSCHSVFLHVWRNRFTTNWEVETEKKKKKKKKKKKTKKNGFLTPKNNRLLNSSYENKGNDHQFKKLPIVEQMLLVSSRKKCYDNTENMNAKVRLQRVMGQRKPSPSPLRYPQIQSPSIDNSNMIILMYQENQQQNQVTQVYLTALIILWYIIITIMTYQKKEILLKAYKNTNYLFKRTWSLKENKADFVDTLLCL